MVVYCFVAFYVMICFVVVFWMVISALFVGLGLILICYDMFMFVSFVVMFGWCLGLD